MNLALVDPFILAQDIPETLIARFRSSGNAVCIRFNRQGDLLASGTSKGGIAIFDLETNGVARKLRGHTPQRQISSLSWSANGRYLLSAAVDWRCILWDLQDGSRLRNINLGAPVFCAELHPEDHLQCIAALYEEQPVIADMRSKSLKTMPFTSAPKRSSNEEGGGPDKVAVKDAKHFTSTALYHPSGKFIISGTTKGWLHIISTADGETIYSLRLSPKPIVQLRLSDSGTSLLTNSADSIIRTLRLPDFDSSTFTADTLRLSVEHKFLDPINGLSWNAIAFSPNSDYVMASTLMNHDIYIWERIHGSLVRILEGPREELGSIDWHPLRPVVAATGVESGRIYVWGVNTPQRWSALAPDFAEVEENQEYIETEGEFDVLEADEVERRREGEEGEAVDVLTIDVKEDDGRGAKVEAFRMPVLLDIDASDSEDDMVAIGAGQYRRKGDGVDTDDNADGATNGKKR